MKNEKYGIIAFVFAMIMITGVFAMMPTALADPGLSTADLDTGLTPTNLVNNLLGSGVSVSNVNSQKVDWSMGTFSGGTGIIGFESGIILSTGDIADVVGPNTYDATTTNNGLSGDSDLQTLIPGYTTHDATVLEFDFVPTTDVITFRYVFGSEEYNEYVGSPYNNVFGFFINGVNQALIPGTTTAVAINNVNNGGTGEMYTWPVSNPAYYRNNDLQQGGGAINTELDGLTVVLTVTAHVNAGVTNHIKLAISDAGDSVLDSDVFIEAESFVSPTLTLMPFSETNPVGSSHMLTAKLVDEDGNPISGQTITFTVSDGPMAGTTGTGVTNVNGEATWSYTGINPGVDTIVATGGGETSNQAFKTWEGESIPEFSTIALPIASILGMLFFFNNRKRKDEE